MGFEVGYDSNGNPSLTMTGEPPPLEGGAAWQILGGGGGVYRPEYQYAQGAVTGTPATGITWGAKVLSAGSADRQVVTREWSVQAALFTPEGVPIKPLACQVVDDHTWEIEAPPPIVGLAILLVTAQKPGLITTLRTFAVLLVAGV